MVEIGRRVVLAGIAITALIDGRELALILTICQVHTAILGKDRTGASLARWRYTVKGICAIFDANKEIIRFANTEQVTWLVDWQLFAEPSNNCAELLFIECATESKTIKGNAIFIEA